MSIFKKLVADGEELIKWAEGKSTEVISAISQAGKLSTAFVEWAKSPQGKTIEQVVESVIPNSSPAFVEVVAIATEIGTDLSKLTSVKSIEALCMRIGGEVLSILDGKKKPEGISGYLAEFQNLFV